MSNSKEYNPVFVGATIIFFMLFCFLIYYAGMVTGRAKTFDICKRITYLIITEDNTTTETITLRFKHQYSYPLSDEEKLNLKEKNFWIEEK